MRAARTFLLVLGTISGVVAQETPQEAVEGDAPAWQEVKTAYGRLTSLRSYRARHPGDPSVVHVVNPDRFHYIFDAGFARMEFVMVGNQYAERSGTGGQLNPWRCFPRPADLSPLRRRLPPMLILTILKRPRVESVRISRIGEGVVERDRTQGYEYTASVSGSPEIRERMFVLSERGLPRRTEVLDAEGKVLRSLGPSVDFFDYDASINISVPRC